MEALLVPEWAPNIHPLLVHFPIAILIIAALGSLLSFFVPDRWWDEQKNTVLYVIGSLSAVWVYFTGQEAADSVFLEAEAQSVLSSHADWALWLVWFFALYALLRLVFHRLHLFENMSFKLIAFITVLPGLFFLFETAEYGGKMVFGHGVGTGQLIQQESEGSTESDSTAIEYSFSFSEKPNGDWTWEITATSVSDLISNFNWIEGTVNQLKPKVLQGADAALALQAPGTPNFFVTQQSYQNVQVDYYLNLSEFSGEIILAHHVIDSKNYDFVSLNSNGDIRQGRMEKDKTILFEEGTFEVVGELFVRVVADGTHFRGYVNKEMIVHGHGDAPKAGSVGLKLSGSGTVLISGIELNQLN